jgi:hypothetical protein
MRVFKYVPGSAAVNVALNPMVQGGGLSDTLGFPSCGHAHHIGLNPPGYKLSAQGLVDWQAPQGIKGIIPQSWG